MSKGSDAARTPHRPLAGLLDQGGEVGKKLDFLLQEMNREEPTRLLSKTDGGRARPALPKRVGDEVGIEKAREQVQNLE